MQVQLAPEEDIVRLFNKGDRRAFEFVYKEYYKMMYRYSCSIVGDAEAAEEIVQTVFLRILEKKGALSIPVSSLQGYLMRSVRNQSMNVLGRRKFEREYLDNNHREERLVSTHEAERLREKDLEAAYVDALNELPEQCRTIFQMSRVEELTYREIAGRLSLSVKTVETQMGRALKKLRIRLAEFLIVVIIIIKLIES